jgi:hypothetical protein
MRLTPFLVGAAAALLSACGSSAGSSSTAGTVVHLTAAGVDPSNLSVASGSSIEFVNDDDSPHEIGPDAPLVGSSCAELSGPLLPLGAFFYATMVSAGATCHFHDRMNNSSTAYRGIIQVR